MMTEEVYAAHLPLQSLGFSVLGPSVSARHGLAARSATGAREDGEAATKTPARQPTAAKPRYNWETASQRLR